MLGTTSLPLASLTERHCWTCSSHYGLDVRTFVRGARRNQLWGVQVRLSGTGLESRRSLVPRERRATRKVDYFFVVGLSEQGIDC
jgi:hypothetical protein